MTRVALDPVDYAAAAANFDVIRSNAVLRLGALSRELNAYDNMAGTDPGGRQFAAEYDAGAGGIVQALDYLAVRASEFSHGLMATAAEHDLAEQAAGGNAAGASAYAPRPPQAPTCPAPPPSAFGGDATPPPEPWSTVQGFVGAMFPDANTTTLRSAAQTWSRISDHLDEVAREVRRADDPLSATRSAEIDALQERVREFADIVALIAADAAEVGESCDEYAASVEEALEETFAMLRQLAIEIAASIGIGVALSFFTFGAAGAAAGGVVAARIVMVAGRITQTILRVLTIAQKAATRIGAVHARIIAAVAKLSPRGQTFTRIGNQIVSETAAAVFAEGTVRGDEANYLSAFAGGFVGAGTTAGVLSVFGSRANTLFANAFAGGVSGFTGSLAAGGVQGNVTAQDLVFGTVFGTAGGSLGAGGTHGAAHTPSAGPGVDAPATPATGGLGSGSPATTGALGSAPGGAPHAAPTAGPAAPHAAPPLGSPSTVAPAPTGLHVTPDGPSTPGSSPDGPTTGSTADAPTPPHGTTPDAPATTPDGATPDAATPDGATPDAGAPDASTPDASPLVDGPASDAPHAVGDATPASTPDAPASSPDGTPPADRAITLRPRPDWNADQLADFQRKIDALNAGPAIKTEVDPSDRRFDARRFYEQQTGESLPPGVDLDHVRELQLGGDAFDLNNMAPLDSSVNRSVGAQIYHAIKGDDVGTSYTFRIG